MFIFGVLLAVLSGVSTAATAVLQKRESVRVGERSGLSLLATLVRRAGWALSLGISLLGWFAEAASLALVPVPVASTMRSSGRAGLVVGGTRWLGERFSRLELVGVVALMVGGLIVAIGSDGVSASRHPASDGAEVILAVAMAAAAWLCSRSRRGLAAGGAVGWLWTATALYTKEIGDAVATHGLDGLVRVAATPGPWIDVLFTIWAVALLQKAYQRANAASVMGAASAVATYGLVAAGAVVYGQPLTGPGDTGQLAAGLLVSLFGAVAMLVTSLRQPPDDHKMLGPAPRQGAGQGTGRAKTAAGAAAAV